jgi:hypothetical protein
MSRQLLAVAFIKPDGVIENELRKAARAEPREGALVCHPPEGEAPVAVESMPTQQCRLCGDARHRFDGITSKFAYVADMNHLYFFFEESPAPPGLDRF